jgi:predicted acetyltransferase
VEGTVNVSLIKEEDKLVLRNLLNLYLYDLSAYKGTNVNKYGFFEYRRLDQYWYDKSCHPFYIKVDGMVAGFILVHQYDLLEQNRHVISEFFILRMYRKKGIGKQSVQKILETFPGEWEVSQLPENLPSHAFWRKVLYDLTKGSYNETVVKGRPVQFFQYPVG